MNIKIKPLLEERTEPLTKLEDKIAKAFIIGVSLFTLIEVFGCPIYFGEFKKEKHKKVESVYIPQKIDYTKFSPSDYLYFGHTEYNQLEKELPNNK